MTRIQVKSFTLEEYHQLTEIGFFKEDNSCAHRRHHIQLINGESIEIVSKGRAHETCLRNLVTSSNDRRQRNFTISSLYYHTTQKRTRTRFCNHRFIARLK